VNRRRFLGSLLGLGCMPVLSRLRAAVPALAAVDFEHWADRTNLTVVEAMPGYGLFERIFIDAGHEPGHTYDFRIMRPNGDLLWNMPLRDGHSAVWWPSDMGMGPTYSREHPLVLMVPPGGRMTIDAIDERNRFVRIVAQDAGVSVPMADPL